MATTIGCVIDWAAVAGVGQTIVAVAALLYAVWQGKQNAEDRHQDRLAAADDLKLRARPKLAVEWYLEIRNHTITARMRNVGLGPAIMEVMEYSYRGATFEVLDEDHIRSILAHEGLSNCQIDTHMRGISPGTMITVTDNIPLFAISDVPNGYPYDSIRDNLKFAGVYSSIYGERIDDR